MSFDSPPLGPLSEILTTDGSHTVPLHSTRRPATHTALETGSRLPAGSRLVRLLLRRSSPSGQGRLISKDSAIWPWRQLQLDLYFQYHACMLHIVTVKMEHHEASRGVPPVYCPVAASSHLAA